jgi:hypothetical protein
MSAHLEHCTAPRHSSTTYTARQARTCSIGRVELEDLHSAVSSRCWKKGGGGDRSRATTQQVRKRVGLFVKHICNHHHRRPQIAPTVPPCFSPLASHRPARAACMRAVTFMRAQRVRHQQKTLQCAKLSLLLVSPSPTPLGPPHARPPTAPPAGARTPLAKPVFVILIIGTRWGEAAPTCPRRRCDPDTHVLANGASAAQHNLFLLT